MATTMETVILILLLAYMGWEAEKMKPKPYPLGNGDTLMVRTMGYEFCPEYCDIDHFHVGHKKDYNCETLVCEHIIYEDRLN
tara:strand:+ start:345 stop:590 length:246 start_codon:yes stop_codon:yes gene_type:complete